MSKIPSLPYMPLSRQCKEMAGQWFASVEVTSACKSM